MRLLLGALVFSASAASGAALSKKLRSRALALDALCRDARRLSDMLELTPMPVREAAARLECEIWKRFVRALETWDVEAAWREACNGSPEFRGEDEALECIRTALCAKEADSQKNAALYLARRLELRRNEAAQEAAKRGKLFSSLGVLIGLALALALV